MKLRIFGAALLLVAAAAPVQAQADDLASKIINDPGNPQVNGAKASLRDDPKVQGGRALRIQVPKKGANPWDSTAESSLTKPVKAGDQLELIFWARLEKGDGGATSSSLAFAGIQINAAPYTSVVQQQPVDVGPEWKMVEIKGKADRNYPAGGLKVSIHLANEKQTIDLGPIVVLDLGPGA